MPCNEGKIDRLLRVLVGLGLLALVFVRSKTPWRWVGLVPLLTGVFGFCPALYPARDQHLQGSLTPT